MQSENFLGIDGAQPQAQEQTYTLKYNGNPVNMSLDELKTAAQKGLNYDKVKAQRDVLAGASPDKVYMDFLEEYAHVDPKSIPEEVWRQANREGSLLSAYRAYEIKQFKAKIQALEQNEKNRQTCAGSVKTAGSPAESDPFLQGLFGK